MTNITESIYYVGVNDHDLDLFEGQYIVPNGMAYNSYVIMDEKIAVMDSVDGHFTGEWLANVAGVLGDRKPDYLIVQHMEPDHSASIADFVAAYPGASVVATAKAFKMLEQFYRELKLPAERKVTAANNSGISLGEHILTFVAAPMVHWPEVMMTYDEKDKILFSADAFGKFGALDTDEDWACEARRYYMGIVGKYGAHVQALFKKLSPFDIRTICPLHGPVLTENLSYYLGLYDTWSAYRPEDRGVFIAYTSVYGNTKKAALLLADELKKLGEETVEITDLARSDMAEAVEDAFRYDRLVLATTTYNNDMFPFMHTFVSSLTEREYKNRSIAIIENGSWAPMAAKRIKAMMENSRDITWLSTVTLLSSMSADNEKQIASLAAELVENANRPEK